MLAGTDVSDDNRDALIAFLYDKKGLRNGFSTERMGSTYMEGSGTLSKGPFAIPSIRNTWHVSFTLRRSRTPFRTSL